MTEEIILSIKPKYVRLIAEKLKNHEFRKRIASKEFNKIIIYTSGPEYELRYIANAGKPAVFPEKITVKGFGNEDFNNGKKEEKYAIPIIHLWELKEPLKLSRLREEFQFVPPQNFCYASTYQDLQTHIEMAEKRKLF